MNLTNPVIFLINFTLRVAGHSPAAVSNAVARWCDLIDNEILGAGVEVTEVVMQPTEGWNHGITDIVISAPISAAHICDRVGIVGPHVDRRQDTVSLIHSIRTL